MTWTSSTRFCGPSLPLVTLIVIAVSSILVQVTYAAPKKDPLWLIQIESNTEQAKSGVYSWYEKRGMVSAKSKAECITIGSFTAMAMPSGGDKEAAKSLEDVSSVKLVASEIEMKILASARELNAPPGLDRIDGTIDGVFNFQDNAQGQGVDIYVIDSGVDIKHSEFGGRAKLIDLTGEGEVDLNGHGTHVSATAAGALFGIAKQANIIGIKVVDATGKGSNIVTIKGLQQVALQVATSRRPSVINMSLGGARDIKTDLIFKASLDALSELGVAIAVAAGNESQDSCNSAPAFVPSVVTVGAADPRNDQFASFSNFGTCVDIIAPGVNIISAKANTASDTTVLSGTSMASPHVAGSLAVLMGTGLNNKDAIVQLLKSAQKDKITGDLRGTGNIFLETTFK